MIETLKNPSKDEWLKERAKNINSTDTAALFGASPYKTEFQLYHLLKGNIDDPFQESERTIIGEEVEHGIAKAFARIEDLEVEPFKDYLFEPANKIGSSFDYVITSGDFKGWLLEIKNVDYLVYRDNWTDEEAPPHIEIQVQHQCMVSNAPGVIILACVGGNSLKHIVRERDDNMIKHIRRRIKKFWSDFDADKEPKPNYTMDVEAIKRLYSRATKDKVYDASGDEEIKALLSNHKKWKADIKRLDAMCESVKAEVYRKIEDASKLVTEGYRLTCGRTKDGKDKTLTVTEDMVGQKITLSKGKKGYRQFTIKEIEEEQEK